MQGLSNLTIETFSCSPFYSLSESVLGSGSAKVFSCLAL